MYGPLPTQNIRSDFEASAKRLTPLPKLFSRLSPSIFVLATLFAVSNGEAGWEFSEPVKKPSREESSADSATARPKKPARIQVFGTGRTKPAAESSAELESPRYERPTTSAEAYAEMLKEDERRVRAEQEAADRDFESVRSRILSRRTAASENDETVSDAVPAKPTRTVPKGAKTVAPASAAKKPVTRPALETEVVTPQTVPGTAPAALPSGTSARGDGVNPAFPYTHLLPSPFNLSQGEWVLGSTVAYGVVDFFQISTNLARTFQQHWNVRGKVPLIEFPTFVASAYVDYESYNPHNIDDTNPDMRLDRWQPGLVTGYEVGPDMAVFLGGNFSFGKDPVPVRTTSGYMKGAQVEVDWSWLYNPSSSRLSDNALSAGVTYDFTYSLLGFGATHHWRNFSLGVHYTIADRARFLPIFGFNVAASF
jgi:hypothetical protein